VQGERGLCKQYDGTFGKRQCNRGSSQSFLLLSYNPKKRIDGQLICLVYEEYSYDVAHVFKGESRLECYGIGGLKFLI